VEDPPIPRVEVAEAIRLREPEVEFSQNPRRSYPPYLFHRDHSVFGRAVLEAVYASPSPLNNSEHSMQRLRLAERFKVLILE